MPVLRLHFPRSNFVAQLRLTSPSRSLLHQAPPVSVALQRKGPPLTTAAMSRQRIEPGPGQESVWDYPRPPACEPTSDRIRVYLDGQVLADTSKAQRVLETSHPPVYYIPVEDVQMEKLTKAAGGSSFCEWKGSATYYDAGTRKGIAWSYDTPTARFAAIKGSLAFYPSKVERAMVNDEVVEAQPGDFYGGWITKKVVGPFKGSQGTWGW